MNDPAPGARGRGWRVKAPPFGWVMLRVSCRAVGSLRVCRWERASRGA
ncbi:MAG: hypothetical protein JWP91_3387 [Fibrobacteres bacterium]|nr:hypothetical protein [Fibrobacterota bacterium]